MSPSPHFPANLPHYTTPLIGRDAEASAIAARLRETGIRLLSLVGTSGTGKTRLALQVAQMLQDDFPAGQTFVSLAPVTDADLALATIARTLDLRQSGGESVLETLIAALADQPLLLILDNVEQVLAVGPLLSALLDGTRRLKLLATSQVPLALAAETAVTIPPLGMPGRGQRLPAASLLAFPAIALFVSRMEAVQPDFVFNQANAAAVFEICDRLRGLPLAIELVAAHSNRLAPKDLLFLLRNYLPLSKESRDILSRKQLLQPVLDWCASTLPAPTVALLAGLSVFSGGWTSDAAAQVCALDARRDAVAEHQATLVEKHLVLREAIDGHEHYLMLDAIHEYARQRLAASPERERIERQHAEYYLALIAAAEQVVTRAEKRRLEREHFNIRAALRWFISHGRIEAAAQGAGAMGFFWYQWGYWHEGRAWLREISGLMGGVAPSAQALVYKWLGVLEHLQGTAADGVGFLERSLEHYRAANDPEGIASVLNNLGVMAKDRAEYATARAYLEESLGLVRQLGYPARVITTLNNLGGVHEDQGEYAAARAFYSDGLALALEHGSPHAQALSLVNLGRLLALLGDLAPAKANLEEGLRQFRELGNKHFAATALNALCRLALAEGDQAAAERHGMAALAITREMDEPGERAELLETWAEIVARNDAPTARRLLRGADQVRAELDLPRHYSAQAFYAALLARLGGLPASGPAESIDDLLALIAAG